MGATRTTPAGRDGPAGGRHRKAGRHDRLLQRAVGLPFRLRRENRWVSFTLVFALPIALALLLVALSARPPFAPTTQARTGAGTAGTGGGSAVATGPTSDSNLGGTYRAEDRSQATRGPTTTLLPVASAPGGLVVSQVGRGTPGGDVVFPTVNAGATGAYLLTVSYTFTGTRSRHLGVWVNGFGPTDLTFAPPRRPAAIATLQTTVRLEAGINSIRFGSASRAYGPDLAGIAVQPRQTPST